MPDTKPHADILQHNRAAWDQQAQRQCEWSRPVDAATIAAARAGRWQVHLTPTPLLPGWLDEVAGKSVLCLASAGGQQGPVLAAQLAAGFLLQAYHEEKQPQPRFLLDRYVPTFIATCALKP